MLKSTGLTTFLTGQRQRERLQNGLSDRLKINGIQRKLKPRAQSSENKAILTTSISQTELPANPGEPVGNGSLQLDSPQTSLNQTNELPLSFDSSGINSLLEVIDNSGSNEGFSQTFVQFLEPVSNQITTDEPLALTSSSDVATNNIVPAAFWDCPLDSMLFNNSNAQPHHLESNDAFFSPNLISNLVDSTLPSFNNFDSHPGKTPSEITKALPDAVRNAISKFLYWHHLHPNTTTAPSCPLPDVYLNHLHCLTTASLLPFLHNAYYINLSFQDLLNYHSPFYKPNASISDDPTTLLIAAQKPHCPAYLQPTLPQILFPHHPYLDLLPFPTLRARAITLANTATQDMFNPMEFKKDVFRDGLVCSPGRGSRQPWDVRDWRVAPWFLKKWRLLLDIPALG